MKKAFFRDLLLAPLLALLCCLIMFLVVSLVGCTTVDMPGFQQPTQRDWSKFEIPPIGTPLTLRVFNLVGPRKYEVVDLKGQWDDGDPFLVAFLVTKRMEKVVRVEIHFRGEVLGARYFKTPTLFEKGRTVGWRK